MRYLPLVTLLLVMLSAATGCTTGRSALSALFTQTEDSAALADNMLSAPVEAPAPGSVVLLGDAGKKNTFIIQTAPNNTANATGTDNTGQKAATGANGGNSQPVTTNKTPAWAIGLVAALACAAGIGGVLWFQRRVRPG